ncbi:MAG TPA: glycosyltransferase family 2 protein [Candidatus Bathyarchaeia archaeon]|nr:glycosyltransferase family 2 protein [Candidatus Bathyarchaeia archaeon]
MSLALLAHVHDDGDIIRAWLDHYVALGVNDFHLVVRGPDPTNRELLGLRATYPIIIRDRYEDQFREREKIRRLNAVLEDFRGQWVLVVDPDEFLELPFATVAETISELERLGATCLPAPLLQRLRADGSLDSPAVVPDPFREFPLCSVDLYEAMGSTAALAKYPLVRCEERTILRGGNHIVPNGAGSDGSPLRGVSHHFKWRRSAVPRIQEYVDTQHPHWEESAAYLTYLARSGSRLPLDGAFPYSRAELFRRGLLRAAPRGSRTLRRLWRIGRLLGK